MCIRDRITPASGYVGTPSALVFGVLGGTACNFATQLKNLIGYDDALDIFAAHAVGGFVGNFLTGLFADGRVSSFDGSDPTDGSGWINRHFVQLGYQLADSCAGFGWSFVVTFILLFAIDHIPGCHLRCSEKDEVVGTDISQVGEEAYVMPHFNHMEAHQPLNLDETTKQESQTGPWAPSVDTTSSAKDPLPLPTTATIPNSVA